MSSKTTKPMFPAGFDGDDEGVKMQYIQVTHPKTGDVHTLAVPVKAEDSRLSDAVCIAMVDDEALEEQKIDCCTFIRRLLQKIIVVCIIILIVLVTIVYFTLAEAKQAEALTSLLVFDGVSASFILIVIVAAFCPTLAQLLTHLGGVASLYWGSHYVTQVIGCVLGMILKETLQDEHLRIIWIAYVAVMGGCVAIIAALSRH
ncbi:hypothetical protein OTU49_001974 [Cherax quadricarinatus]|uniref:Transmembrane protein n=1 Tax=Cherax quadricarinatus TaxID=27406 RepID=A0AAW0XTB3_CHEQU